MYIDNVLFFCVGSLVVIIGYLLYAIINLENRDDKFGNLNKNEFIDLTVILNNFLYTNNNYDKVFNICKVNSNILELSKWLISEDRNIPDINNVLDFSDSEYDSSDSSDSSEDSFTESGDDSDTNNKMREVKLNNSDKYNNIKESSNNTPESINNSNESSNNTPESSNNIQESSNNSNNLNDNIQESSDNSDKNLVINLENNLIKNIDESDNLQEINLKEEQEIQHKNMKQVNLLNDYTLYLNHFGRSNFSPNMTLNRYIKIKKDNVIFFINYAQLNFFKWIIKVGLYNYIESNKEQLMEEFEQFKNKKYQNKNAPVSLENLSYDKKKNN